MVSVSIPTYVTDSTLVKGQSAYRVVALAFHSKTLATEAIDALVAVPSDRCAQRVLNQLDNNWQLLTWNASADQF